MRYDLTPTELAYYAGFFDGEGCINAHIEQGKWPYVTLMVSQRYGSVTDDLLAAFGGAIHTTRNAQRMWKLNGASQCLPVLVAMYPYLRLKKSQCFFAILLCSRMVCGFSYDEQEHTLRCNLCVVIKHLKRS